MRKITISLFVMCLLTALIIISISCGDDNETKTNEPSPTGSGQLPVLHVGDEWQYWVTDRTRQYNLVYTVTGVDEYYSMSMKMDPPLTGGISEAAARFDKELLLPVWMEMSGEDPQTGMEFDVITEASYELSNDRWPLEVGKETQITETLTTIMNWGGEDMTETISETATYKVEALENVVVQDAVYSCYQIVKYDDLGRRDTTSWHSDIVKASVREIHHGTTEIQELVGFSVR